MPTLVAAIQSHETQRLSANHSPAPMTAPAISPPASAAPAESTPSTTRSASSPPIGKLIRTATGQIHKSRASVTSPPSVGSKLLVPRPPSRKGTLTQLPGFQRVRDCARRSGRYCASCELERAPPPFGPAGPARAGPPPSPLGERATRHTRPRSRTPGGVRPRRGDPHADAALEIPPVPDRRPARPHLAGRRRRPRADLVLDRPARRQPGARQADGRARASRRCSTCSSASASRRSRSASRRRRRPTSTSSASWSRTT